MTARGILIGLLGAVAILATFAFSTADRASAEDAVYNWSIDCHPESNVWYVTDGNFRVTKSDIPCDEAKPGWTFDYDLSNVGGILFLYDGDRTTVPVTRADGTVIGSTVREVNEQGNTPPPVNQPLADGTNYTAFTYNADANNRAVRGDDNQCYREQRISGRWKRSGSYGFGNEACRKASWNAYYRSQGGTLLNPFGSGYPSGNPPAAGN